MITSSKKCTRREERQQQRTTHERHRKTNQKKEIHKHHRKATNPSNVEVFIVWVLFLQVLHVQNESLKLVVIVRHIVKAVIGLSVFAPRDGG